MSPIDAETQLYINGVKEEVQKDVRSRDHKLRNELQKVTDRFGDEREKNDKRYSPMAAWKILIWVGLGVGGILIGAIMKLLII